MESTTILAKKSLISIVILFFSFFSQAQTYFNNRIDIATKQNLSITFYLNNDTFLIPTIKYDSLFPPRMQTSLMQIKTDGTIISSKTFKRKYVSLQNGQGVVKVNSKYYSTSIANDTLYHIGMSFYVFNATSDTILVRLYGDTTYYFYGYDILKNSRNPNQLIIFGGTDSTCGANHPGFYKPMIWVIDTLGNVVTKKLFLSSGKYRTFQNADTSRDKGYVYAGSEYLHFGSNSGSASFVMNLDSNLNLQWINYFDTTVNQNILTLKSGKHILSYGRIDSNFANTTFWSKVALMKLNENGSVVWKKQYGVHTEHTTALNSKELPNGDLIVCGITDVLTGNINYPTQLYGFLMRTDSLGNQKWFQTYKGTYPTSDFGQNYLYDVMPMNDGGFAAVGFLADSINEDTWLIRVDSVGCIISGCNVGIENLNENFVHLSTFPNPVVTELVIEYNFEGVINEDVTAQLFEPQTEKVVLQESIKNTGSVKMNLRGLPNGIYFLNFYTSKKKLQSFKIIKLE